MDTLLFWPIPAAAVAALAFAWYFHRSMKRMPEGTDRMRHIAAAVRSGAMSYLRQQYKVVGIVFLCLVVLFAVMAFGFNVQNHWVPVAFLTGGFFSGLAGYLGMRTATQGLGPHGRGGASFAQRRPAHRLPQRRRHGTGRRRPGPARHLFLVRPAQLRRARHGH